MEWDKCAEKELAKLFTWGWRGYLCFDNAAVWCTTSVSARAVTRIKKVDGGEKDEKELGSRAKINLTSLSHVVLRRGA